MPKSLLDSTTFIDIQRAANHSRDAWAINTLRHVADYIGYHGKLCTSTLTVMEIVQGLASRAQSLQVFRQQTLPAFDVIGFDEDAACLAGEIFSKLESARQRIGIADTAVAAVALTHGLTVVTSNDKHFQRVVSLGYGLTLENWRNP